MQVASGWFGHRGINGGDPHYAGGKTVLCRERPNETACGAPDGLALKPYAASAAGRSLALRIEAERRGTCPISGSPFSCSIKAIAGIKPTALPHPSPRHFWARFKERTEPGGLCLGTLFPLRARKSSAGLFTIRAPRAPGPSGPTGDGVDRRRLGQNGCPQPFLHRCQRHLACGRARIPKTVAQALRAGHGVQPRRHHGGWFFT